MLSDLVFAGGVSTEELDRVENKLVEIIPYLCSLNYIDLSTHISMVSIICTKYFLVVYYIFKDNTLATVNSYKL